MLLKHTHQPREVEQGSAEAIHLINHDAIDFAGLDMFEQVLQRGPVEIRARESAVVVIVRNGGPAQMPLALDVRFGGFALRLKRVELLVEPSSVDLRV